jgi:hypothetical protein
MLKGGEAKMVNCVSTSASVQHIEALISTNNNLPNNQRRLYCQYRLFALELRF